MTYPIMHTTWQILRAMVRSRSPVLGRDLRIVWTRQTKDGSFLSELVRVGLLSYATGTKEKPFEATYTLTAAGKYAAEYGEYECGRDHVAIPITPPHTGSPAVGKRKAK